MNALLVASTPENPDMGEQDWDALATTPHTAYQRAIDGDDTFWAGSARVVVLVAKKVVPLPVPVKESWKVSGEVTVRGPYVLLTSPKFQRLFDIRTQKSVPLPKGSVSFWP